MLFFLLAAAAPVIHYTALGDSFSAGTSVAVERSFPAQLAARWHSAGAEVAFADLAVNGYTTQDLIRDELPELEAHPATVVTLLIGANDIVRGASLDTYRAQVRRILARIWRAGVKPDHIYCVSQPDWAHTPTGAKVGDTEANFVKIQKANRILAEEAKDAGAHYADLFLLMRGQAEKRMLSPDELHPSEAALREWSEALFKLINP